MTALREKPILFVSPLPPPQGGIAVWTKKLIENGLPDGTPISVVDTKISHNRNIFDQASFNFAELIRTCKILTSVTYQFLTNRPKLMHLNSSLSTTGIFREWICGQVARLFRIPYVVHFHGNMQDFREKRFYGLSGMALSHLMQHAKINIVTNTPSLQHAEATAKKNLILIPNFIEDTLFDYSKKADKYNDCTTALFAGGITYAKGCKEIFNIALALPEINFHLYGKMHADLADLYKTIPNNIILHGEVEHHFLMKAMQASDFLLFPSHTEGFPLTILEAMSIGLPVIATRVGAIPEMIIEGNGGLLVNSGDLPALIHSIRRILTDSELRQSMGEFNRERSFTLYRYSVVIHQLASIYRKITLDTKTCAV